MSDGEPIVSRDQRGIEVDAFAIGGTFQILAWLAEDSPGAHSKFE